MILSASRRTDIPNYYADWFYNRIKEGFLYVRNPVNYHQVSKICLSPELVDCIVFWTKNPQPMLKRLMELEAYQYYFQFTLTGYGQDIERNIPHKRDTVIPVFQKLARQIGRDRVIWRYDPILLNDRYTRAYHVKAFRQIAEGLEGYTKRCVISFIDLYAKNKKALQEIKLYQPEEEEIRELAMQLSDIAHNHAIDIISCAEELDLSDCGIGHGCCIDKGLIERITGCVIEARKDKNQRKICGCVESVEIGSYDTCKNGCIYCYANASEVSVRKNWHCYDVNSPLLCSHITKEDKITERKLKSFRRCQLRLE